MTIYPQLIIDALKQVRYPGTGKNLIEAEMLEDDMRIDGMNVSFSLLFEKPTDPFIKSVVKAAESTIHTFVDKDINVAISVKTLQKARPEVGKLLPDVKNIIAVSSGKGGVDADIFGPSIPKMLHLEQVQIFAENKDGRQLIIPAEKYGVKVLSIGFFVNPNTATLWRGGMASNSLKQLIADTDWGDLDYFILDTPPGTGDIHLTLLQTLSVTGAVIVSTPQQVALADARKGIDMYKNEKVNVPILGLVENMAWFTPKELPENRYYLFGKEGVANLATEMHVPLLGQIPIVQSISESGDEGEPVSLKKGEIISEAFRHLAQEVVKATKKRNESLPPTTIVEVSKH